MRRSKEHIMLFATRILGAVLAGIASHVCIFIKGEWHLQAPKVFRIYLALFAVVVTLETLYSHNGSASGFSRGFWMVIAYCTSLFASIAIYRQFLHPLCSFPGPVAAGVTKLWHMFKTIASRNHLLLDSLYHQYGAFIRTGAHENGQTHT